MEPPPPARSAPVRRRPRRRRWRPALGDRGWEAGLEGTAGRAGPDAAGRAPIQGKFRIDRPVRGRYVTGLVGDPTAAWSRHGPSLPHPLPRLPSNRAGDSAVGDRGRLPQVRAAAADRRWPAAVRGERLSGFCGGDRRLTASLARHARRPAPGRLSPTPPSRLDVRASTPCAPRACERPAPRRRASTR